MMAQSDNRWYPTQQQLKDPVALERSFRQLLKQHYELHDKFDAMREEQRKVSNGRAETPFPRGSGPSDTVLLGLHVQAVDVQTLADGAKLTFMKKDGSFKFV